MQDLYHLVSEERVMAGVVSRTACVEDTDALQMSTIKRRSFLNSVFLALMYFLWVPTVAIIVFNAQRFGETHYSPADATVHSRTLQSTGSNVTLSSDSYPEVVLLRTPQPPSGYVSQGSLYRGTGYWAQRPTITLQEPTAEFKAVTEQNRVFLFGGNDNGTVLATSKVFDAVTGLYADLPDMPEPRSRYAAAILGSKIYIIGGYNSSDPANSSSPDVTPLVFDLETYSWGRSAAPAVPRSDACAAVADGKVYLIGGLASGNQVLDSIEEYDPSYDEWTTLGVQLPSARTRSGCAAINSTIYVAGGISPPDSSGSAHVLKELLSFSPAEGNVTRLPDMSSERASLNLLVGYDKDRSAYTLFAVGGQEYYRLNASLFGVGVNTVEQYLPLFSTWVQQAPLDQPRYYAAAAYTPWGLFVWGGYRLCTSFAPKVCSTLSSVEVYQSADNPEVWVHTRDDSALAAGNTPPESDVLLTSSITPSYVLTGSRGTYTLAGSLYQGSGYWAQQGPMAMGHLSDFIAVGLENQIYISGGEDNGQISKGFWLYDVVLGAYKKLPDMPYPRYRHAAEILGRKLYVIGGFDTYTNADEAHDVEHMLVYDIDAGSWSVEAGPNVARSDACAAAVDDKLYLAGGYGPNYEVLSSVEMYDPARADWTAVRNMPTPRGDTMCASLGGLLYVVGGYWDPSGQWSPTAFRDDVEAYDPNTGYWSPLSPMPFYRGDAALVQLPNGRLMVMGGETSNYEANRTMVATNSVAQYIASQDLWTERAPMIESRFRFDAAYAAGTVFVFGGDTTVPDADISVDDTNMAALRSVEAYYITQNPDVFVWLKE